MNDVITINSTDIAVKEYSGKRVVTFKDIDTVHNRPDGTARKRFNDNKERFVEGEDFFKVPYDWDIEHPIGGRSIFDADTVEKYEAAMNQLETDFPKDKSAGTAVYIRAYCKAFRTLYDTLFGAGTAARIFDGISDNIRKYTAVYGEFLAFVSKQAAQSQTEMVQIRRKYLPKGGKR